MSNMPYCRFQNTVRDLADCQDHVWDTLSKEEAQARRRLVKLCHMIAEDAYEDIDDLPVE